MTALHGATSEQPYGRISAPHPHVVTNLRNPFIEVLGFLLSRPFRTITSPVQSTGFNTGFKTTRFEATGREYWQDDGSAKCG
jgi:hypothetical protein